jgi:hypothetical protein
MLTFASIENNLSASHPAPKSTKYLELDSERDEELLCVLPGSHLMLTRLNDNDAETFIFLLRDVSNGLESSRLEYLYDQHPGGGTLLAVSQFEYLWISIYNPDGFSAEKW